MSHWRTRIGDKLDILLQETLRIAQAKSGQKRGVHGQIKKELRRRSAIEAVIGHCKTDGHPDRYFLHGHLGDQINAAMSAVGYNFHLILKWIRLLLCKIIDAIAAAMNPLSALKSAS